MNKDGYGTKSFLAVIHSLTFAAIALWLVYHFGNENLAAAAVGAAILIARDLVSKFFSIIRTNGESEAKTLPTNNT